jgi:hypothetical protein
MNNEMELIWLGRDLNRIVGTIVTFAVRTEVEGGTTNTSFWDAKFPPEIRTGLLPDISQSLIAITSCSDNSPVKFTMYASCNPVLQEC